MRKARAPKPFLAFVSSLFRLRGRSRHRWAAPIALTFMTLGTFVGCAQETAPASSAPHDVQTTSSALPAASAVGSSAPKDSDGKRDAEGDSDHTPAASANAPYGGTGPPPVATAAPTSSPPAKPEGVIAPQKGDKGDKGKRPMSERSPETAGAEHHDLPGASPAPTTSGVIAPQ